MITSISFDHMGLLGRTIGRIAGEKAGIIKRGCPVVSGAVQPAARRVIADTARRRRARLLQLGRDFTAAYEPPAASAAPLARPAASLSLPAGDDRPLPRSAWPAAIRPTTRPWRWWPPAQLATRGYRRGRRGDRPRPGRARLPARLEVVGRRPLVVVDGAHNVASMESLVAAVEPALTGRRRPRVLAVCRQPRQAGGGDAGGRPRGV